MRVLKKAGGTSSAQTKRPNYLAHKDARPNDKHSCNLALTHTYPVCDLSYMKSIQSSWHSGSMLSHVWKHTWPLARICGLARSAFKDTTWHKNISLMTSLTLCYICVWVCGWMGVTSELNKERIQVLNVLFQESEGELIQHVCHLITYQLW